VNVLRALRPRSYRARIAVAIIAALAIAVLMLQIGWRVIVQGQVQDVVERNLALQAQEVAVAVDRVGVDGAIAAERFLPDTSMVVREQGVVLYWNEPVQDLDARAVGRSGDITVTLERRSEASGVDDWAITVALGIGLVGLGVLVWLLSGRLARRLRAEAQALADQAERVAAGDLSARAPEPDDELGRVAAAMNRMTEQLDAADARQREFLADVAHELRTPVTAIDGFATALADGTAHRDEDRTEAAEFIREEAARLSGLVRDLQQLTVLDLDPRIDPRPADLAELGRQAVTRLSADAQARGIDLQGPAEDDRVAVVTDAGHVETVLANLVTNALRATPPGGRVRVVADGDHREAWLRVEDTGRGIAAEHLPRLFDRLYRVDPARGRTDQSGSGLGLAIVRRSAEVLGGRVEVESEVGRGSAFTLRLPAAPAPVPPREATPEAVAR
jgi:signal transduction histidine kinase